MEFDIGISMVDIGPKNTVAGAVAWFSRKPPELKIKNASAIKQTFPAITIVRGCDRSAIINAASNRIAEKLLIRNMITQGNPAKIKTILATCSDPIKKLQYPLIVSKDHWLLELSNILLKDWLQNVQ